MKIYRIKAYILRHLYEIWTSLDLKIDIVFWPTIDLLTFGLLTIYIEKLNTTAGLAGAVLGGLILWTLVYNIQKDITFSLLVDVWSRNLFNILSTPLRVLEMVSGILLLSIFKATITISIIVGLAKSLFDFNLFQLGPIVVFYIFNIFIFAWSFGFLTSSLILRFGTKVQAFSWSLLAVIYPISGVFYPLETLPPFLAKAAHLFPVSYIFEGLRSIILSGTMLEDGSLVAIPVLNACYLMLGIWLYISGFKSAKARGWFIHPT